MAVRTEEPSDRPAVRAVVAAAFTRDGGGVPPEVPLLDRLRECDGWLPELSLVATDDTGSVRGHVVCTRARVGDAPALGLGPLAVAPGHQRTGIGSALVRAALDAAAARGEHLVGLLGDPAFYGRFGFRPASPPLTPAGGASSRPARSATTPLRAAPSATPPPSAGSEPPPRTAPTPDLEDTVEDFDGLTTPLIADACVRCGVPPRVAPAGVRAVLPGTRLAGRALPARHYGSVDVFLEACAGARPGDVLVIDNGGRADEACVGDLTALEAAAAGIAGLVVWGLHRDTAELAAIGLPVLSYGALPLGPLRADPREDDALRSARFGRHLVTADDLVFADDDGVLFLSAAAAPEVLAAARRLAATERAQADRIRAGVTLREQTAFGDYLRDRAADPALTFRTHLRRVGGAVEE